MFDISSMVAPHIDAIKPHLIDAGHQARSYADRVIDRLDLILDELKDEEWVEQRIILSGTKGPASAAPLGGNVNNDPIAVPAAEEWLLENVVINCQNSDSMVRIIGVNPSADIVGALNANNTGQVLASGILWGGRTFAGTLSFSGNGVIVEGNTPLYIHSPLSCDYRVQFKRRRVMNKPRRGTTGMTQLGTNVETLDTTEIGRHTGTWRAA